MGHKRYGYLPKTKVWRDIVKEMGKFSLGAADIDAVARKTLEQVREQYENLENDPSVKSSFEFLIKISHAFQKENPVEFLLENNILDKAELTPLKIARALKKYKENEVTSHEYSTIAKQAAVDAISKWYNEHIDWGHTLFSDGVEPTSVFSKAAKGAGFSELSRLYFSKLTERYLRYFLDREASMVINNIDLRDKFSNTLEKNIDDISKHALETSKITQSYSAGWFNKNSIERIPNENEIRRYIEFSFGKMRSELIHEGTK